MNWTGDVQGINYSMKVNDPSDGDKQVDGADNLTCANANHTCDGSFTTSAALAPDHTYNYTIAASDKGGLGEKASYSGSFTLGNAKIQSVTHAPLQKDGQNYEQFKWNINLLSTHLKTLNLSIKKGADAAVNYPITTPANCFTGDSTRTCSFSQDVPITKESTYTYTITATPTVGSPHSVSGNFNTADLNFTNVTKTAMANNKMKFEWQVIPVSDAQLKKLFLSITPVGDESPVYGPTDIRSSCTPIASKAEIYNCSFTSESLTKGAYKLSLTASDENDNQYKDPDINFTIHDLTLNQDFSMLDKANYTAELKGTVYYSGDDYTKLSGTVDIRNASGSVTKGAALTFSDASPAGSHNYPYTYTTVSLTPNTSYTAGLTVTANGVSVENSNAFTVHQLKIETPTTTIVNGEQIKVDGTIKQPGASTGQTLKTLSMQVLKSDGSTAQEPTSVSFSCNGTVCSYSVTSKDLSAEGDSFTVKLSAVDSLDNTAVEKSVTNIGIEQLKFGNITSTPQANGSVTFNWTVTPQNSAVLKQVEIAIGKIGEADPVFSKTISCFFASGIYNCTFNTAEASLAKGDYALALTAVSEHDKEFDAPATQFGNYTLSLSGFNYTDQTGYKTNLTGNIHFSGKSAPTGTITLYQGGAQLFPPVALTIKVKGDAADKNYTFSYVVSGLAPGDYTAKVILSGSGITPQPYDNLTFTIHKLKLNNDVKATIVGGDKVQVVGTIEQPGFEKGQKVQSIQIVLHNSAGSEIKFSQAISDCNTKTCSYTATNAALSDDSYLVDVGATDNLGNVIPPAKFASVTISPFTFSVSVPQGSCPSVICSDVQLLISPSGGQPAYNLQDSYSCTAPIVARNGMTISLGDYPVNMQFTCQFTVIDSASPQHSVTKNCTLTNKDIACS